MQPTALPTLGHGVIAEKVAPLRIPSADRIGGWFVKVLSTVPTLAVEALV